MEKPLEPSVLQSIEWLKDQLEEQESLVGLRVDYILKQIVARFGGEIESWRVIGCYEGQTILDCIGENFVNWYHIEWKKYPQRLMTIQTNNQNILLGSEFPTRWLTENFEEELEKLTSENSL